MQAEIGQNRLIFPMRTKRPESIAINGVTEPAGAVPRTMRDAPAKDTQEDALPLNETASAVALSAMSQRQDNVGRLPPANRSESRWTLSYGAAQDSPSDR